MKFGRELLDHIKLCEANAEPCSPNDYIDYKRLKRMIKTGVSEKEFQEVYDSELARFTDALKHGRALKHDTKYAILNRKALDKISKKFDKRLDGQVRYSNWVTTTAELGHVLGALQIDDSYLPPDLRRSTVHDSTLPQKSAPPGTLVLAAGAISGITSRTLTAPLDRIKLMLQAGNARNAESHCRLHIPSNTRNSLTSAFQAIRSDGGIRAFWQGNGTNVIKELVLDHTFNFHRNLTLLLLEWSKATEASLESTVSKKGSCLCPSFCKTHPV